MSEPCTHGYAVNTGDGLDDWPNCETPDCQHKHCCWATDNTLCFPCNVRKFGRDKVLARWDETHDGLTFQEAGYVLGGEDE